MKIIYHFRVKGVGPERVHISGIAGAFKKLGHSVSFVSPTNINPLESGDTAPPKGRLRNLLYFLADKMPQVFFELMEMLYNILAIMKLKKKLTELKPQLVYERYAFFCFAGIYLCRKKNIPIVIEVNEIGGFDRVRPQKLITLSKKIEKYNFSNASAIITVSEFLKKQIISRGGKEDSILVVPNGIDASLFQGKINSDAIKEKLGISNAKVIGFVGYLVHWHNLDMLIEVYAKIRLKHPNTKLIFVGDGILRGELENLAKAHGVESDFIITGRINHTEVPEYINLFDIAVIPNSNEYRSPIKMFEYMAMGKAIVAPDQPPIISILKNRENGLIFRNGSAGDLYESLDNALMSDKICREIGNNAKRTVFEKFTWDCHAVTIFNFLKQNRLIR